MVVFHCPACCHRVQRALHVVGLVLDHVAYLYQHIYESLPGCPIVTDAHPFAEVWMENRGNHCAFRLQPWVICMQADFYDMCVSTLYSVSCCIPEQPGNMVGY